MLPNRKTYFVLDSSDYKPDELIKLGQIICDPLAPYEELAPPLKPLPSIHESTKDNYSFDASHSVTKSAGIFAEALGIISLLGGDISGTLSKDIEGSWHMPELYTQFIQPSNEYVELCAKQDKVLKRMRGLRGKTVYMITGIKIARDADRKTGESDEVEGKIKITGDGSATGVPLKGGVSVAYSRADKANESYSVKHPFVVAIRLREISLIWGNVESKEVRGGQLSDLENSYGSGEKEKDNYDKAVIEGAIIQQGDFGDDRLPPGFRRKKLKDDIDGEDCQLVYSRIAK
jgi:hypothetical protein